MVNVTKKKTSLVKCLNLLLDKCVEHEKTHVGSSFSTLPTLFEIYTKLNLNDKVVLSNGHSSSALYVVLEEFYGIDSNLLFSQMGDHPKRDVKNGIWCSTGSLGMGISVAVGMAFSNPKNDVHCVISDGECAEGVVWESLAFAEKQGLINLHIYVVVNGYSAYDVVDSKYLVHRLKAFYPRIEISYANVDYLGLPGLSAHYNKINVEMVNSIRGRLSQMEIGRAHV